MASSPLPCAIIGTDGYAFELIKRIQLLPEELSIVAACSLNTAGEGARLCRNEGAILVENIPDLFDLLPRERSVIFNPTPIPLHFETTRHCLDHGFNVALEKPPVPTVQELDELSLHSQKCGKEISVGFNYLFSNVCRTLRQILRDGGIGRVRRMRAMAAWSRSTEYYVGSASRGRFEYDGLPLFDGALGNPLSHVPALMLSLAAEGTREMAAPISVQAELYRGRDYVTSDDTASVRVITDSGVELILNLTVAAARNIDPVIEIDGESGRVLIDHFEHCKIIRENKPPIVLQGERESRLMMLAEIARARQEERPPLITLAKCRPFTQTVNAAYESAGGVMEIPIEYRRSFDAGGQIFHCIRDIEGELMAAHAEGRLLAEGTCPWARQSPRFSAANYHGFFGARTARTADLLAGHMREENVRNSAPA